MGNPPACFHESQGLRGGGLPILHHSRFRLFVISTRIWLAALMALPTSSLAQQPIPAPQGSPDLWVIPAAPAPAPISREEHASRRRQLMERMGTGVLVVLGADEPDSDYMAYAQNSPFRYLTGVTEPGAALVIDKRGATPREILFVRRGDPSREVWEGPRMGARRAQALTGIPTRERETLDATLDSLLARPVTLFMISPLSGDGSESPWQRPDQQFSAALAREHPGTRVEYIDEVLFRIRAPKSPAELDHLRRAIYITALAHREAMRAAGPGMNEFELHALIDGTFRRYGAERPAFASIVGSGPNSTTLHYRAADRFMQDGETLVMDIGASYRGYAADVTRTVPVNGTLLRGAACHLRDRAQGTEVRGGAGAARSQLRRAEPGRGAYRRGGAGGARADRVRGRGIRLRRTERAERSLPAVDPVLHAWPGSWHRAGRTRPEPAYFGPFRVGSAFTIEPGVYVRADVLDHLPDTPANRRLRERLAPAVRRYANIGVRIEDDYFITADGVERISIGSPREIAEIEALMAVPSAWNGERRGAVVEWYRGTEPR
jgi:Xaa-Pro aminopeptidase